MHEYSYNRVHLMQKLLDLFTKERYFILELRLNSLISNVHVSCSHG